MFWFKDVPDLFGVRWLQTKLIDRLFKRLETQIEAVCESPDDSSDRDAGQTKKVVG